MIENDFIHETFLFGAKVIVQSDQQILLQIVSCFLSNNSQNRQSQVSSSMMKQLSQNPKELNIPSLKYQPKRDFNKKLLLILKNLQNLITHIKCRSMRKSKFNN
jgi:hypothetical protein